MFGYIKIDKPELKMKDYEIYHSVYCSLCKALGHRTGILARLSLNYDFTFLALLKLSVGQDCPGFVSSRCSFNPLVKCGKCTNREDVFAFTCAAAGWVLYYKALDSLEDDAWIKRAGMRLLLPLFRRMARRGAAEYPELEPILKEMAEAQRQVEQKKTSNLDEAAHPSATMLGRLFALGEEDSLQRRVLERLGYCLGRYVYFMDAADDLLRDLKSGGYNPFLLFLEISKPEDWDDEAVHQMDDVIQRSANGALEAFYLLHTQRYGDLLENIIKSGLQNTKAQVLYHKKEV